VGGQPGIYVTESTGTGPTNTKASGNLVYEVQHEIMDPIRDGAKASLYWNLALEDNDGPQSGGCKNCRPMVTVDQSAAPIYNEDFYYWEQFSRFVHPGAVRIGSSTTGSLDSVAFKEQNGTVVVVVLNDAK
jgi:glucosylceramidase